MGSDRTSTPLHALAHAVSGAQIDSSWTLIHRLIRKSGHFLGYGLFSLALYRALSLSSRQAAPLLAPEWRLQLAAVAAAFLVAGIDELHQAFVPNRTGKFADVLLDTAGAVALQLLLRFLIATMGSLRIRRRIYITATETAAA